VSTGDAENDHAFLGASECGVAVANAIRALQDRADIVTKADHGSGVVEIIDQLIENDLQPYDAILERSSVSLGTLKRDSAVGARVSPNRNSVLVAGASGSGKSSAVAGILEKATEQGYQFCLIDPEGDFGNFAETISIGSRVEAPAPDELATALKGQQSIVVNLMAVPVRDRPAAFAAPLPKVTEARVQSARPHWLVIDEAYHLIPSGATVAGQG
jgi:DNA helicase HerA-like ATPase